jgi:hypothetical protein
MNNKAIELAKLTVLALGISNAQAGPLVTNWDYVVDNGFSSFTPAAPDVTPSLNNPDGLPTKLSWGVPVGLGAPSSFSVIGSSGQPNGRVVGSMVTNGPAVPGSLFVHENFVIEPPLLTGAVLAVKALLTPTAPPGPDVGPFNVSFDIHFLETENTAPCDVTSPTPCNDIFVLDVVGAGFDPGTLAFVVPVPFDGNDYTVRVALAGLALLSDAACGAVGRPTGCIGFTTVEEQTNEFRTQFSITGIQTPPPPVPEPGILSLFAVGLIGLRQLRRKQALA